MVALVRKVGQELIELSNILFNILKRTPKDKGQVGVNLAKFLLFRTVLLWGVLLLVSSVKRKLAGSVSSRLL